MGSLATSLYMVRVSHFRVDPPLKAGVAGFEDRTSLFFLKRRFNCAPNSTFNLLCICYRLHLVARYIWVCTQVFYDLSNPTNLVRIPSIMAFKLHYEGPRRLKSPPSKISDLRLKSGQDTIIASASGNAD